MKFDEAFSQKFGNMKLAFLTFLHVALGKSLSALPEKLLLYQNITGIDDQAVWKIFDDQSLGKKAQIVTFSRLTSGLYDNTYPKFRYTGTAPSGDIAPVVWSTEKLNVDAIVNGGVFLCLRPGYYHFTASMTPFAHSSYLHLRIRRNSLSTVLTQ